MKIKAMVLGKLPPGLAASLTKLSDAATYSNASLEITRVRAIKQMRDMIKIERFEPSYKHRTPVVDYKRQEARGTLVEGIRNYELSDKDAKRLHNYEAPYAEDERQERMKYSNYNVFVGLGVVAGFWTLWDYQQSARPIVWCADQLSPHAPFYPFYFKSRTNVNDIASVRRGYEVYRQVCATCHSMQALHWRHLSNTVLPEARIKELAAEYERYAPGDDGYRLKRPMMLKDQIPSPYPNDTIARYSNGGALPPDLSIIVAQREHGVDYIMALLTGFKDPPHGIELRPGLYWNPWMQGGVISMAPPLIDGQIDYEDGTPSTVSQMSKDVAHFLTWACFPRYDEKKIKGIKYELCLAASVFFTLYWYRFLSQSYFMKRVDFGRKFRL